MSEKASNAASFEELAMPLFAKLYNLAHWLTQNREQAEDLVQETYMKALKGFRSFQPGTNFQAWMYRILRNTFLTSVTGLKATATISLEDEEGEIVEPAIEENPESLLLARADQDMVQTALKRLPLFFREIILLCDLEEMSYKEIGDTLGVPIGTVMSRLSRARKAMRKLLDEQMRGPTNVLRMEK